MPHSAYRVWQTAQRAGRQQALNAPAAMKVQLEKTFPMPASADTAWALLQDIEGVASCMPGAKITERIDATHYKGTVAVKLGPAACRFAARSRCRRSTPATRTLQLVGKGTDTAGGSGASMDLTARDRGRSTQRRATWSARSEVSMSGKAAAFGGRMMGPVADQVLEQFAGNFAAQVQAMTGRTLRLRPRTARATDQAATAAPTAAPERRQPHQRLARSTLGRCCKGWRARCSHSCRPTSRQHATRSHDVRRSARPNRASCAMQARPRARRLHRRAAAGRGAAADAGPAAARCCSKATPASARPRSPRCWRTLRGTRLIRLQCYEGLDAHAAMYEWNYQRQLLAIKLLEHDERGLRPAKEAGHLLRALPAQAPAARGDHRATSRRCC